MKETDREKFIRLANKRVNNAIKSMELIGNLANRTNYDYSNEDVEKIFSILNKELKNCRDKFNITKLKKGKFSLV